MFSSNRLDLNGMNLSDWSVDIAAGILKEYGSVMIFGAPMMDEPVEFYTEERLRAWAEKFKSLPN